MDLIYCAGGNYRFAEIAVNNGFLFGSQLPAPISLPVHFADQDWKNPNRETYIRWIKRHKPSLATVLDWEKPEQYDEVMDWAHEISDYVKEILIIPKIPGTVKDIPHRINGKRVRIAYSVPTRYGGSPVTIEEIGDRPVHLLGGSPHKQMSLFYKMNVASVDGNYTQKMAVQYNTAWFINKNPRRRVLGTWKRLDEIMGKKVKKDAPYIAFEISCKNVRAAWDKILNGEKI